jgi:hypothetical protein
MQPLFTTTASFKEQKKSVPQKLRDRPKKVVEEVQDKLNLSTM